MTTISGPRIGVALGGGSARGLIHIAFIEAMDELGLKPSVVAGTSIGALIGAGWAQGMPGSAIRAHAYDVLGTMRAISGRLWTTQLRNLRKFLTNGLSMQLDATEVVDAFLPEGFPIKFGELGVPLYVIATDFTSWHQVVFHTGELRPAIAGSVAIPSLFRPVEYGSHLLVDGGVVNPLPLDVAANDVDILIGIDVNGEPSAIVPVKHPSPLDIVMGSAQIMMHQLTAHMMAAYPPDVYFRPHVKEFGAYEYWRVREIVEAGDVHKERFKREVSLALERFIAGQQKRL